MNPNKPFCIINYKNCNYITSIKYINIASEIIPSILLVFGVNILYKQYQHNNLDGNIIIGIRKTGYTNNNIVLK